MFGVPLALSYGRGRAGRRQILVIGKCGLRNLCSAIRANPVDLLAQLQNVIGQMTHFAAVAIRTQTRRRAAAG